MTRPIIAAAVSLAMGFLARAEPFPGTQPLEGNDDLAVTMVDGIHAFLDRHNQEVSAARKAEWDGKFSPPFVESKRERLRTRLGLGRAVPEALPVPEPKPGVVTILDRSLITSGLPGVREAKIPRANFCGARISNRVTPSSART